VNGDAFTFDLSDLFARLRDELRDELLAELRAEQDANGWPEWMSVETAARYLDVLPERVRKLKDRREIPFHQEGVGCRVFFARRDLDEWMQTFRHEARKGGDAI
jgi:excisionase family DNA binding protein